MWGRHGETIQIRSGGDGHHDQLLHDDGPRAAAARGDDDRDHGADQGGGHLAQLQRAEAHRARQQGLLGDAERHDQEAERDDHEQRLDGRLAIEAATRPAIAMPTTVHTAPAATLTQKTVERSRSVSVVRCDEGGAQGEVGEDVDQAREHEHEGREAVVVRASGGAPARCPTTTREPCLTTIEMTFHSRPFMTAPRRSGPPREGSSTGPGGEPRGAGVGGVGWHRGRVDDRRRAAGGGGPGPRGRRSPPSRPTSWVVCGDRIAPTTVVTPPRAAHCR